MKGRVKWWCNERGYGFIEDEEQENYFVHLEGEDKDTYLLKENEEIEFTLQQKSSGLFLKLQKAK